MDNLKGGRFILAQGFSSWSVGSIAFGPVARQNIVAGNMWLSKAAYFLALESEDRVERILACPLTSFHWSHLLKAPPPPNSAISRKPSLQHMSLWRTLQIQKITVIVYNPFYILLNLAC
jgi:hypothetical protein